MIQLIRVYRHGEVIHAEAYGHDEYPVDDRHPHERCRCIPTPLWRTREYKLTNTFPSCEITVTPIYPTTK